jgi:hypothetical protein
MQTGSDPRKEGPVTPTSIGTAAERQGDTPAPLAACPPLCPLCQGRLVPQRDRYRCSRCGFSLCVGCADGDVFGGPD